MTKAPPWQPGLHSIQKRSAHDGVEQMRHFKRVYRDLVDHRVDETPPPEDPCSSDDGVWARGSSQLRMKPCESARGTVDDGHQSQVRDSFHGHRAELFEHCANKHFRLVGAGVLQCHEQGLLCVRHEADAGISLATERKLLLFGCDSGSGVYRQRGEESLCPGSPDLRLETRKSRNPRAVQWVSHLEFLSGEKGQA